MRKILLFLAFLALCVHHARADEIDVYVDCTSSASTTWTGSTATFSSYYGYNNSGAVEYYSSSCLSAGTYIYQTVSGLEAGTYKVLLFASAHVANIASGSLVEVTSISDAVSEVAQVYATSGSSEDTVSIPAYAKNSLDSTEPLAFSVTVDVEDGASLEFGIKVLKADYVNWLTTQLVALYKVETVELGDDVTNKYIGEPGFENCTAESSGGSSVTVNYTGTNWSWTHAASSTYAAGAVLAYGSSAYVGNSGYTAPSEAWDADEGTNNKNALGVQCRWSDAYSYYTSETTTLPAGTYTLVVHTYNTNTGAASYPVDDYIGFVPTSGTASYCGLNYFEGGEWDVAAVSFTLDEETEGAFRLGYGTMGSYGSGNTPELFFDDLTLYYTAPATTYDISDYVVGSPNWGFEKTTASTASFSADNDHGDYTDTGWTAYVAGSYGRGGVLAYGGSLYCNSSTYGIVPDTGWDETTITSNQNTLGMGCSWGNSLAYSSDTISLPAGTYKISVHTYNSSTAATDITAFLTGFVALDGTTYYIDKTSFTSSTWETSSVTFTLTEETVGYVSVGILGPNSGASGAPVIYFDDITLVTETEYSDESPITTIGTLTADIEDGETLAEAPTSIIFGWVGGWSTSSSLSTSSIGALSTSATATLTASGSSTSTSVTLAYDSDTGLFTADLSSASLSKDVVYTLTIPVGIYGWSSQSNAETTISFSITSFEAGTYVFQVKDEYKYLSHGGSWGTQAVAGEMGIPFTVEIASGGYTLLNYNQTVNAGSNKYVYLSSNAYYVDGSSPAYWRIESTDEEGEYYLLTTDGDYLSVSDEVEYSDYYHYSYLTTVSSKDDAVVWVLHEMDEEATDGMSAFESYYETLAAMKDEQAAATAELAGLSNVSSMKDMASLSGYTEYDRTWAIQNAEMGSTTGWSSTGCGSGTSVNAFSTYTTKYVDSGGLTYMRNVPSSAGTFYQTISDLPDGIYRVSAVAGYNASSELWDIFTSSIEGIGTTLSDGLTDEEQLETSPAWLYANSSSQRVIGLADGCQGEVGEIDSKTLLKLVLGNATLDPDTYLTSFRDSFYVYVGEGESLTIGGIDPGSSDTTIILAANWELTFLSDVACKLGTATLSLSNGDASSDGSLTVTYPYAWTVDSTNYESASVLDSASVKLLDGSNNEVATGTLTAASSGTGFTVSFSGLSLTGGATYTISISENSFGFATNTKVSGAANEAIEVSFVAKAVDDGYYYLRTADDDGNYLYWSRGGAYNCCMQVDEYGLPIYLTTTTGGVTLYFLDSKNYVYDVNDGTIYGDVTSGNIYWTLTEQDDGGYVVASANTSSSCNGQYAYVKSDSTINLSSSECTVWTLEDPADHNDNANAAYDRQALGAAEAAGIDVTSISTRDALAEYLASTFSVDSITLTTPQETVTEDYQGGATTGWGYSFNTLATQTTTLSEGLYKFSVQGFHRFTWNETTEALGGARGQVFLYAGDEKVNVLSPFDYAASSYTATDTYSSDSYYYPNGSTSATEAFTAGYYANDVYFYVSTDDTEVTLALIDEQGYGSVDIGQWTSWQNFSLVQYSALETVDVTVSAGGYATLYYGDYDLQVPNGMTAYVVSTEDSVDADNEVVYLTAIEDGIIPKGTGVVLGADAGSYELSITTTSTTIENNLLKGTDVATLVSDGSSSDTYYYVLSYASTDTDKSGSMGFYVQKSGGTYLYNNAHKAYLPLSASTSSASVKGFSFVTTDGTTGISSVESSESAAVKGIYTLTGIRLDSDVSSLPAGLYIIDGKKALIHK